MKLKGTVLKEFGFYKVGISLIGGVSLMKELEKDGFVQIDEEITDSTDEETTSSEQPKKRGRKSNG